MWERLLIVALGLFVVFKITLITYRRRRYPEPHEDWSTVDLDAVSFPESFRWGTATAARQVEGYLVNNWPVHEAATGLEPGVHARRADVHLLLGGGGPPRGGGRARGGGAGAPGSRTHL